MTKQMILEMGAQIKELEAQRNRALNECVEKSGKLALATKQIQVNEEEIGNLKCENANLQAALRRQANTTNEAG